jgi:ATP-dependent helicase/nuclease subunit A
VQRVARLLLHGAKPGAVLCVTYTKAAAAEMQRRLYERLGHWAVASDETLRAALVDIGERPDVVPPRRARKLFAEALETPGGLKIQTIHAFCEKLLRRFPLEAGVSPGFIVAEGADAEALSADARVALARLVLDEPGGPVATAYEQFAVDLAHDHFEALLKALEGKRERIAALTCKPGYEATVWRRCGFADGEAVDPESVRATAVAAPQLNVALWREIADTLAAGGTHADCVAVLRSVVEHVTEGRDAWALAISAFCTKAGETATWPEKAASMKRAPALQARWLAERDRIFRARDDARAAVVARDTVYALVLGAAYGAAYERLKRERGALDFSDLVHRTHNLLTVRADAAWVLYKLDGGIDHVLVDEAQDTAPEQWDILRALSEEFFAGAGALQPRDPERTVFAVGDEKQSIYSFQGARPERLRAELERYDTLVTGSERVFRSVALEESWRSTPQVLRFVDAVFAHPDTRIGVPPPPGQDVVTHRPLREDDGCVDLWPPETEPAAPERDAWDKPVDDEGAGSARKRLARRIAQDIKRAVARGETVGGKGGGPARAATYGDFLILVRRRDPLFEEIIRALKLAGVPVGGADRLKLSEHILFEDLLALARVSLFPGDDLSLAALLRSPFFDVDEDSLYALARGREGSLWSALRTRQAERPEWAAAHSRLSAQMKAAGAAQPYEFFARFLAATDDDGRSMTARAFTRLGREAEDALEAFLSEAIAAESRGVHGLEAFAAALERSALEVKREQDEGRGEVRVMTVTAPRGWRLRSSTSPTRPSAPSRKGSPCCRTGRGDFSTRRARSTTAQPPPPRACFASRRPTARACACSTWP